ncbi:MAG: metal-sensitive transcriptional regulator [Actinomycetota bacterium]
MDVNELGEESVAASLRRLRKVEGQVRAVQRMIEEGRDCEDVLRQVSAAQKALKRVGVNLAVSGLQHCVIDGEDAPGATEDLERFRRSFIELA